MCRCNKETAWLLRHNALYHSFEEEQGSVSQQILYQTPPLELQKTGRFLCHIS